MRREPECPHCGERGPRAADLRWYPSAIRENLDLDRACQSCAHQALRDWLNARLVAGGAEGCSPYDHGQLIPYGVLPVAWQLGHPPRFTGRDVTVAFIDSGFYPHPELIGLDDQGHGRLRLHGWADTSTREVKTCWFHPLHPPRWPGWSRREAIQWHGTMTAGVAAGDGRLSHGWYQGVAPDADLVFVQCWDTTGHITNASIARALRWLMKHRQRLRLRVVNISVYGDPLTKLRGNYVDAAVRHLVEAGVVVVTASGNSGRRELVPPATAAHAITVGGVDLRNSPLRSAWRGWRTNWGRSSGGTRKPDLLAPAEWVPALMLPGSPIAAEAVRLFEHRDSSVEERIRSQKLITPYHQHVDGTSFAAAIVSGLVACMIEARPTITPTQVRDVLLATAAPLPDVPAAQQGAGVVRPSAALEHLLS